MGPNDDGVLRALIFQKQRADVLGDLQHEQARAAENAISTTEALLRSIGVAPPQRVVSSTLRQVPQLRPWHEILEEARAETPANISFADLLTVEEIQSVVREHRELEAELSALHEFDSSDWIVSGVAGVLAALVDIFLVQVPRHSGFLGSKASKGGWLSNVVKERIGHVVPADKIHALEREYPVSYDPSTSATLTKRVPGLGPGTHRFQSLGHDPILGWIFGVRDLLSGELSAMGKDGSWVVQATAEPFVASEHLFMRVFEALRVVGGHLLSDVATARGLPAPLMPLLLFLQKGHIGKHGYTVGEVARQMYRTGYDFRHFLASSIPVLLAECIVRIAFFAKSIHSGASLADAVPLAHAPRLRSQLLLAHSVATAVNAGKVYVTSNPLAVSWSQWLAFFRYLLPQLHWLLVGAERDRRRFVQARMDEGWKSIEAENKALWRRARERGRGSSLHTCGAETQRRTRKQRASGYAL